MQELNTYFLLEKKDDKTNTKWLKKNSLEAYYELKRTTVANV